MIIDNEKIDGEDLIQIKLLGNEYDKKKTLKNLDDAWDLFLQTGEKSPHLRQKIFDSWLKSTQKGINPFQETYYQIMPLEQSQKVIADNQWLIQIASVVMQGLLSYNNHGHINLTTADGIVLYVCGLPITPIGSILTEEVQGTNCTGRCINEKKLVYVLSAEIYNVELRKRNMDCAAAPIKDANNNIIGIITLTMGENELFHYHSLGTVQAAANAISHQMQLHQLLEKEKMFIEALNEGVVVIDHTYNIHAINNYARQLFQLEQHIDTSSLSLQDIAYFSKEDLQIFNNNKYQDLDLTITLKNKTLLQCMLSVTPIPFNQFILSIREKKRIHKITQKIMGAQARYNFNSIIGHSSAIQYAINIAKLCSKNNSAVLILGESGTGKELFAQAIHNASKRKDEPFIAVNCGALPRELVQSELFGYVEGAFTGAKRGGVPGKFELANGGTIFLDEIGDMPIEVQTNLLRVIQENEITRIGSEQSLKIDVRIIAATNKNLQQAIINGAFRQDLYYRLNVMSIYVPALKDRVSDIPELIHNFQTRICVSLQKPPVEFSDDVIQLFKQYPWPGNVRELENIIERCIHFSRNQQITLSDIPAEIALFNSKPQTVLVNTRLKQNEMKQIIECLHETHGNLRQSALLLGLSRGTLYNKLNKYNINPDDYR